MKESIREFVEEKKSGKKKTDKDVLKQQQGDFEKSLASAKKEIARIKRPEPITQPLVRRNAPKITDRSPAYEYQTFKGKVTPYMPYNSIKPPEITDRSPAYEYQAFKKKVAPHMPYNSIKPPEITDRSPAYYNGIKAPDTFDHLPPVIKPPEITDRSPAYYNSIKPPEITDRSPAYEYQAFKEKVAPHMPYNSIKPPEITDRSPAFEYQAFKEKMAPHMPYNSIEPPEITDRSPAFEYQAFKEKMAPHMPYNSFDQPLDLPPVITDRSPAFEYQAFKEKVTPHMPYNSAPDVPDNPFDDPLDNLFDEYGDDPFDDKYAIRDHGAWGKAYENEVIKPDRPPQTWDYQNTSNVVESPFDEINDRGGLRDADGVLIENPFDDKYASTPDKPGWGRPKTIDTAQYLKEGATTPAIEDWDRREMERLNANIANAKTPQELQQAEMRKRKRIATKKFAGKRLVDKGYEIDLDWMRNNKNRKLNDGTSSGARPLRTNTRKRFFSLFRWLPF